MSIKHYPKGNVIRVVATFKDLANALQDPSAVNFSFKTPAGVTTTYVYQSDAELVRESAGVYHVDINASTVGAWHHKFFSTGTGQAAAEGTFVVDESNFS